MDLKINYLEIEGPEQKLIGSAVHIVRQSRHLQAQQDTAISSPNTISNNNKTKVSKLVLKSPTVLKSAKLFAKPSNGVTPNMPFSDSKSALNYSTEEKVRSTNATKSASVVDGQVEMIEESQEALKRREDIGDLKSKLEAIFNDKLDDSEVAPPLSIPEVTLKRPSTNETRKDSIISYPTQSNITTTVTRKKDYNPEEAREFMKKQKEKRKLEAKHGLTSDAYEKEKIKSRLNELKNHSKKIVAKNLIKNKITPYKNPKVLKLERESQLSKSMPSTPSRPEVKITKTQSQENLTISPIKMSPLPKEPINENKRRSLLDEELRNPRIGILRRPDGEFTPSAIYSPLKLQSPKTQAEPVLDESPDQAGDVTIINTQPIDDEENLKLKVPDVRLHLSNSAPGSATINNTKDKPKPTIPQWLKSSNVTPYPYNFIEAVRRKMNIYKADGPAAIQFQEEQRKLAEKEKQKYAFETPRSHLTKKHNRDIVPDKLRRDARKNRFSDFLMEKYINEPNGSRIELKRPDADSETNANTSSYQDHVSNPNVSDANTISEISSIKSDAVALNPLSTLNTLNALTPGELLNPMSSTRYDQVKEKSDDDTTINESILQSTPEASPKKIKKPFKLNLQEDKLAMHRGSFEDPLPDRVSFGQKNVNPKFLATGANTLAQQNKFLQRQRAWQEEKVMGMDEFNQLNQVETVEEPVIAKIETAEDDKENHNENEHGQSLKDQEYQKMLIAFNNSLSHVIEVNQLLYTALKDKTSNTKSSSRTSAQSVASSQGFNSYKSKDYTVESIASFQSTSTRNNEPPVQEYSSNFEHESVDTNKTEKPSKEKTEITSCSKISTEPSEKTLRSSSAENISDSVEKYRFEDESSATLVELPQKIDSGTDSIKTQINGDNGIKSFSISYTENAGYVRNFKENDLSAVNASASLSNTQNHLANITECQQKVLTTTITCNTLTRTTKFQQTGNSINAGSFENDEKPADESDIFAGFNESELNGTLLTDLNCSYTSLGMIDQLIKTETHKSDVLTTQIKNREKALIDRTKGQIAWLELQKQKYKQNGMIEKISAIKKKQRAILVRLEKERADIKKEESLNLSVVPRNAMVEKYDAYGALNLKKVSKKEEKALEPVRGYGMKSSGDTIEKVLLRRESELQKRRKHVESLMEWHHQLDENEREVFEMEQMLLNTNLVNLSNMNSNALKRTRSYDQLVLDEIDNVSLIRRRKSLMEYEEEPEMNKSLPQLKKLKKIEKSLKMLQNLSSVEQDVSADPNIKQINRIEETVDVLGSNLNKLWKRLTGRVEQKFLPNETFQLNKKELEDLYEKAKLAVLEDFQGDGKMKNLLDASVISRNSMTSKNESRKSVRDSDVKDLSIISVKSAVDDKKTNDSELETMNSISNLDTEDNSLLDNEVNDILANETGDDSSWKFEDQMNFIQDIKDIQDLPTKDQDVVMEESKPAITEANVIFFNENFVTDDISEEEILESEVQEQIEDISFPVFESTINDINEINNTTSSSSETNESKNNDTSQALKNLKDLNDITAEDLETELDRHLQDLDNYLAISEETPNLDDVSEALEHPLEDEDDTSISQSLNSELEKRLIEINDSMEELSEVFEKVPIIKTKSRSQSPAENSGSSTLTYSTDKDFKEAAAKLESSTEISENLDNTEKASSSSEIVVSAASLPLVNLGPAFIIQKDVELPKPGPSGKLPDIINEAEVLRRQQLEIENEIKKLEKEVFFREIPTKPPPPYPEYSEFTQNKEESEESLTIPPSERIEFLVSNKLNELCEPSTEQVLTTSTGNVYERIILDLVKEYFQEFKRPENYRLSYMRKNNLIELYRPSENNLELLQAHIVKKIKKILLVNQNQPGQTNAKPFHVYLNNINYYCNTNKRKRDNVDEILVQEMLEDESKWLNYDLEECEAKNNLTNEILDVILEEALADIQEAYQRKLGATITKSEPISEDTQEQP